jgi:hypothetical protein
MNAWQITALVVVGTGLLVFGIVKLALWWIGGRKG